MPLISPFISSSSTAALECNMENNVNLQEYRGQPDFDDDEYGVANMIQEAYLNTIDRNSKLAKDLENSQPWTLTNNLSDKVPNGTGNGTVAIAVQDQPPPSSSFTTTTVTLCGRQCTYKCLPAPSGRVARYFTFLALFLLGFGNLWAILGDLALPYGYVFCMLMITLAAWVGGELIKKIRLPPLLGMLIVGFMLRNIPQINLGQYIDQQWSSAFRNAALGIILTRAGMGLDIVKLKKLGWVCARMAILPCLAEIAGAGIAAHYLLGMPWLWAFMLGSILSGLSPAVVVPGMLAIQQKGLGVDKGIPTLGVAAISIDDALAVAAFGVVYGITFATGTLAMSILQGPLEVLMGFAYGIIVGILLWYLPHGKANNVVLHRFLMMFTGSMFAIFGSRSADYGGAGAIGCLIFAFVAAHGWRKEGAGTEKEVSYIYSLVWLVFQPILFGLIGAEINISEMDGSTVGKGLAALAIGIVARIIIAAASLINTNFNWKEKIYIQFTGLPKATVQAAVGPLALDTVRSLAMGKEYEILGFDILTIAVLSILITAPIGAIALSVTAEKLLKKSTANNEVDMSDFAE